MLHLRHFAPSPLFKRMLHTVEGQWKNFTFKILTPADFPAVSSHLRENYYVEEPLRVVVGTSETSFKDFDRLLAPALTHNLTLALYDQNGNMAGTRVIEKRSQGKTVEAPQFESQEMTDVHKFFTKTESLVNVYELHGVKEYPHFLFGSVGKDFRGAGIAMEMYQRSKSLLTREGFKVATTILTCPFQRKVAAKFGFEQVGQCFFNEIADSNGKLYLPDAGQGQFAALMVLKL